MLTITMPRKKEPKPSDKKAKSRYVNVGIHRPLAERLRAVAESKDRSLNYIVREACKKYLDEEEKQLPQKPPTSTPTDEA